MTLNRFDLLAGILLSLPNFLLAKQKGVLLMNYKDETLQLAHKRAQEIAEKFLQEVV